MIFHQPICSETLVYKRKLGTRYYWQISSPNVAHGAENLRYQEFQDLAHKNGQNTDDDDDLAIAVFSLTM